MVVSKLQNLAVILSLITLCSCENYYQVERKCKQMLQKVHNCWLVYAEIPDCYAKSDLVTCAEFETDLILLPSCPAIIQDEITHATVLYETTTSAVCENVYLHEEFLNRPECWSTLRDCSGQLNRWLEFESHDPYINCQNCVYNANECASQLPECYDIHFNLTEVVCKNKLCPDISHEDMQRIIKFEVGHNSVYKDNQQNYSIKVNDIHLSLVQFPLHLAVGSGRSALNMFGHFTCVVLLSVCAFTWGLREGNMCNELKEEVDSCWNDHVSLPTCTTRGGMIQCAEDALTSAAPCSTSVIDYISLREKMYTKLHETICNHEELHKKTSKHIDCWPKMRGCIYKILETIFLEQEMTAEECSEIQENFENCQRAYCSELQTELYRLISPESPCSGMHWGSVNLYIGWLLLCSILHQWFFT